jgi:hypothetical protein
MEVRSGLANGFREMANIEATTATVPADLEILKGDKAPCGLPPFAINLHLPKSNLSRQATELARYLRDGLSRLQGD